MSERTHSTAAPLSSFTTQNPRPEQPNPPADTPQFTPPPTSGKRGWGWYAGGSVMLAAIAVGVFQFTRQDELAAAPERSATATQKALEQPLARVEKQLITWEMVARECMERYGEEVLEAIINRTIIQQACRERGVEVTTSEVNQKVSEVARTYNLDVKAWYTMLHSEQDLTPLQYQRDVIWPMLALRKIAGKTTQVSEADLQKAFESHYGPRANVLMIMLDRHRDANAVWNEAKANPDNFERLAQDRSVEPNSRSLGGKVPPIRKHVGNPQLVAAAFKLRPGEISPIVQLGTKFVILKGEGFTEPVVKSMTPEIRTELLKTLNEEKAQEAVAKVFSELKEKARVDNYLKRVTVGGNVKQASGSNNPETYPSAPTRGQPQRN